MLRPSYTELMEVLNNENNVDGKITSRYTIVIAAAKRARQLIDGSNPLTYAPTDKAVSIAVKEMYEGRISIKSIGGDENGMLGGSMLYGDYDGDGSIGYPKRIDFIIPKDENEKEEFADYDDDEMETEDLNSEYDKEGYSEEEEILDYDQNDDVFEELEDENEDYS